MASIECKECGTVFEGRGKACYCSVECRKAGNRKVKAEAQKRWAARNPNYWNAWVRAKLKEDPDYFAAKMREYESVQSNLGIGSGQHVHKVDDWTGVSNDPTEWTDDQRRAYEDIQRLKRLSGL